MGIEYLKAEGQHPVALAIKALATIDAIEELLKDCRSALDADPYACTSAIKHILNDFFWEHVEKKL